MTSILGIDPGASGGIALLSDDAPQAWKMPDTERDIYDLLAEYSREYGPGHAYLEAVHAMPKQGLSSTWKFAQNYGFLRGCLIALEIPFETVTPRKWQQAMGCLTHGDKNVSKRRSQELFPHLRITHATADSLLIATFGQRLNRQEQNHDD